MERKVERNVQIRRYKRKKSVEVYIVKKEKKHKQREMNGQKRIKDEQNSERNINRKK